MTMDATVLVSIADNIATVVLNRPEKRNAMDGHVIQQLNALLQDLASNNAVRVLIVKASGDHFCAGADIAWMQKMATSSSDVNVQDAMELALLMHRLYTFPKPVISLAQGMTLGGGLGLLAASDIVIAASNASFVFSEVKLGLVPSVISPYIIAAIGARATRYYFLTATRFDASDAHRLGLIHQIAEPEALDSVGFSVARALLQSNTTALVETKQLVARVSPLAISESMQKMTALHLAKMRASVEASEGLQAFLEKRTPNWS